MVLRIWIGIPMLTCEWNSNQSDTSCLLQRKFEKKIKYESSILFIMHCSFTGQLSAVLECAK